MSERVRGNHLMTEFSYFDLAVYPRDSRSPSTKSSDFFALVKLSGELNDTVSSTKEICWSSVITISGRASTISGGMLRLSAALRVGKSAKSLTCVCSPY